MQHRVEGFDAWNADAGGDGRLDRRPQEGLDFHWASGLEILVHGAGCILRYHFVDSPLAKIFGKRAALGGRQLDKLINDI